MASTSMASNNCEIPNSYSEAPKPNAVNEVKQITDVFLLQNWGLYETMYVGARCTRILEETYAWCEEQS